MSGTLTRFEEAVGWGGGGVWEPVIGFKVGNPSASVRIKVVSWCVLSPSRVSNRLLSFRQPQLLLLISISVDNRSLLSADDSSSADRGLATETLQLFALGRPFNPRSVMDLLLLCGLSS